MKKIAVLRCLRSNDVCAGAACLEAFYEKKHAFAIYAGEEVRLAAFFSCNGCGELRFKNQQGILEKLERLSQMGVECVHIGVCASPVCTEIQTICRCLAECGIKIIYGTHR